MQAIVTKYLGPTTFKGGRISAKCNARKIIVDWDQALNPAGNHLAAAKALATSLGWDYGEWIAGDLPDGASVFVCNAPNEDKFSVEKVS